MEIVRSGWRECVHHGCVVILDADGTIVRAVGDVHRPMLPRSANKPLQASGMLHAGLELDDPDLALVCASHNGEPEHIQRVLSILARHGLTEQALRCPPDLPLHEASAHAVLAGGGTRRRVFMNCSGKHAGMLATCVHRGWPTSNYTDSHHPLQAAIAETVAEAAGEPITGVAVDGCGAPLLPLSLVGLARAYAVLVRAAAGTPPRRVAGAMRAHPFLVAGSGRDDTRLMAAVPGLLCKSGAEGVHAAALPDGRAVALKIADGASRARMPVLIAALRTLGVEGLDELAEAPVLGGGDVVGQTRLIRGAL